MIRPLLIICTLFSLALPNNWENSNSLGLALGANHIGLSFEKWQNNHAQQFSLVPFYNRTESSFSQVFLAGYRYKWGLSIGENWQGLFGTAQTRNYMYLGGQQVYIKDRSHSYDGQSNQSTSSISLINFGYGLDHQYETIRLSIGLGYSGIYYHSQSTQSFTILNDSQKERDSRLIFMPTLESSFSLSWGGRSSAGHGSFELDKGYWQNSHAFGMMLLPIYMSGITYTYWGNNYGLTLLGLPIFDKSWQNSQDEFPINFYGFQIHRSIMDDTIQKSLFGFSNNHFFATIGLSYAGDRRQSSHSSQTWNSHLGLELDKELGGTRFGLLFAYHLNHQIQSNFTQWASYPSVGLRFEFVLRKRSSYE